MKRQPRKLTLARETLLHLDTARLRALAAQGYPSNTDETYIASCGCVEIRTGSGGFGPVYC
jgi:hypothetical protein